MGIPINIDLEKIYTTLRERVNPTLPGEELSVSLEATVVSVECSSLAYRRSNGVIGPGSHSTASGRDYISTITINIDGPVKRLEFGGWPPLEKGDKIRAYVIAGDEVRDPLKRSSVTRYTPRELREKEKPFKLEKLRDGEVVATYRA
ncbi:hypothetical protein D6789_02280 [Candidatus Woesearchaeota archaeon]|nr:MAG: hypothetical protein D6789_02280 [Candidatus Woesearchaeota archaeon]